MCARTVVRSPLGHTNHKPKTALQKSANEAENMLKDVEKNDKTIKTNVHPATLSRISAIARSA
ncbi:MAG: hypothetical protein [Arizlama microvirus]|nr:MAG: hypothetical protein [Arizlama microvirus]